MTPHGTREAKMDLPCTELAKKNDGRQCSAGFRNILCHLYLSIGRRFSFINPLLLAPGQKHDVGEFGGHGQSLEAADSIGAPSILSSNTELSSRIERGRPIQETRTRISSNPRTESTEIMHTRPISPESFLAQKYRVPRRSLFEFSVTGNFPVNTYVVNEWGLSQLESRRDGIDSFGGYTNRKSHYQKIELERGDWYLVIANPHLDPVIVSWEVIF